MTDLIEVKVSELSGAALDWAVASATDADELRVTAHGSICCIYAMPCGSGCWTEYYQPSTDWEHGGPLIEKYLVDLHYPHGLPGRGWWAQAGTHSQENPFAAVDATPLIAACRAIVASVIGPVVSVPKELCQ